MDLTDWQWTSFITEARVTALIALALNVVYAFVILLIAIVVSGWVKGRIEAFARLHPKVDKTLFSFLGNVLKYLVLAMAVIFVLNRFGIQTTSLVALIGAAGLAIGLALQGTLSNLAAGVMIVMFRPFRVGDFIEAGGQTGSVREIALFYTEMATYDGLQIIMPNSDVWSKPIKNFSGNATRMIDLTIGIAYGADLQKAQDILTRIAAGEARALSDPAPFVKVKELGESSVDFAFRIWVKSPDWWNTRCDLLKQIKLELDGNEIEIPFPCRTLYWGEGSEPVTPGTAGPAPAITATTA